MQDLICEIDPCVKNNFAAISALESGQVLHVARDNFQLLDDEKILLTPEILDKKSKNISFDQTKNKINGLNPEHAAHAKIALQMMRRYADLTAQRLKDIFPKYYAYAKPGRTSYRPAEIHGRKTSKRKDDTRVHVDAFTATPVHGLRILRFFCNINPNNQARTWHLGEPFAEVIQYFAPQITPYQPVYARLIHALKITKTRRSLYDHQMLQLHDRMKTSDKYQQQVTKQRVNFAPNSSWIVFTDHVSHAALSGQFVLEQTFYIPVEAMQDPMLSPIKQLESWWAV